MFLLFQTPYVCFGADMHVSIVAQCLSTESFPVWPLLLQKRQATQRITQSILDFCVSCLVCLIAAQCQWQLLQTQGKGKLAIEESETHRCDPDAILERKERNCAVG